MINLKDIKHGDLLNTSPGIVNFKNCVFVELNKENRNRNLTSKLITTRGLFNNEIKVFNQRDLYSIKLEEEHLIKLGFKKVLNNRYCQFEKENLICKKIINLEENENTNILGFCIFNSNDELFDTQFIELNININKNQEIIKKVKRVHFLHELIRELKENGDPINNFNLELNVFI